MRTKGIYRLAALLTALVLAFLLASCGAAEEPPEKTKRPEKDEDEETRAAGEETESEEESFLSDGGRVIVVSEREETSGDGYETSIVWPVVYLPRNPGAAERINQNAEWNEELDSARRSAARTSDTAMPEMDFTSLFWQHPSEVYATAGALSITLASGAYAGGAQFTGISSYIFDTETGEMLDIGDLLDPDTPGAEALLSERVTEWLGEYDNYLSAEDVATLALDGEHDRNWSLTAEGLRVAFGPNALWEIDFYGPIMIGATVPYSELDGIIAGKYLPADRGAVIADAPPFVKPAEDTGGYANEYGTRSGYALVTEGDALDVCFGDVFGSSSKVLFYASVMTAGDCFWIGETEENAFLLRYTLMDGTEPAGRDCSVSVTLGDGEILTELLP